MATSTEVVTLEDVVGATSEMRLTLKKKSESLTDQKLIDSKESDPEKLAREVVENLINETNATLVEARKDIKDLHDLDEKAMQEAVQQNIEKMKAITEKTVQNIRRVEKRVIAEMIKLPIRDQPQVLTFWESAQTFFGGVMDWLSNMFKYVVEKIRQGFRIVKNAITGLFDTVCRFLGNVFKSKEQIEKEQKEREQKEKEQRQKNRGETASDRFIKPMMNMLLHRRT